MNLTHKPFKNLTGLSVPPQSKQLEWDTCVYCLSFFDPKNRKEYKGKKFCSPVCLQNYLNDCPAFKVKRT